MSRLIDGRDRRHPSRSNLEVIGNLGHRHAFASFCRRSGASYWEVWRHGESPTDWACTEVRTVDEAAELLREWFPSGPV